MWRALAVFVACFAGGAPAQERLLPLSELRSGVTFAGANVRAMQADDLANPGMLWVERGETLWNRSAASSGKACASCHGAAQTSMRGVAAHYPKYVGDASAVLDLEARINDCRTRRQQVPALARESEDLLALSAFVAYQSRGAPLAVSVDGAARAAFDRGREFYFQRHGQMNIACTQCHDQNWGKRLLAETISQGNPTAFPGYRLEWQSLGSLQRRLRACLFGIRAEMPAPGAPELTDLELYLAWRAQGLPLEAPGVRR
ncbi:MAG TPA: sulfur oxidation c-type cytochrome SoxA [Casimicrobiaceae bacterium]|nr:sulfur oxidation c-type cytochrome SoxA [Casimicrobiaceae bacterium]